MSIDKLVGQVVASGALSKAEKARRKAAAKKARRLERRTAKQQLSIAAAAQVWEDREGKARPTPERRQKGAFVLRDGDDAGVAVAVDEHATMLDILHAKGMITAAQRDGGHDLAALLYRTRLVSAGRSCLDMTPVGHDSGEVTHAELRDARERAEIYLACGMVTFAELRRVCCEGQYPRNMGRLRHGLDLCVAFWQ